MRLEGKVAIVTGGGSGIGRETCLRFAAEGAKIVVADLGIASAEETVALGKAAGGEAVAVKVDVSKAADAKLMVDTAEETYGKLDILFNNAGISHSQDDDAVTTEEDVWDLTFDVNVKGVFLGCKYGIPALRRNGGGTIINTASFVAILGAATPQLAYTSSKGAVLSMSKELAAIHARENIRVNAIPKRSVSAVWSMYQWDASAKQKRLQTRCSSLHPMKRALSREPPSSWMAVLPARTQHPLASPSNPI